MLLRYARALLPVASGGILSRRGFPLSTARSNPAPRRRRCRLLMDQVPDFTAAFGGDTLRHNLFFLFNFAPSSQLIPPLLLLSL